MNSDSHPQTDPLLPCEPVLPQAATTPAELFAADGDHFILLSFATFLRRVPSDEEWATFRRELSSGTAKSRLAARVRYHPSGRHHAQPFDLVRAHWLDRLIEVPLLGKLVELAAAGLALPQLKRTLHSQAQQLVALAQLEQKLAALSLRLAEETQSLRDRHREQAERLLGLNPAQGVDRQHGPLVDEGFYLAFEEHFRGSEAAIRARLEYYLPLLSERLPITEGKRIAIDIGCGRGEWLQLLQEQGFDATGLDLNQRNVDTCVAKGLNAQMADAIQWLRDTPSNSVTVVTSFHVIEHLPLAALHSLLVEAMRCLQPGGLIILETPNPENLITAAHRFYTDPSHRHPLPPDLMEFMLKYKGYEGVEIHRLHPAEPPFDTQEEVGNTLAQLCFGPQDYAVIGQKP